MPELDLTFALAAVVVFGAAAVSGLAGFGFSIVSVPMLLLVYPPATVIALNKILTLGTTWIVLLDSWRAISWRHLARLLPFAAAGLFAGIAVLKAVDEDAIKLAVGVVVILFALLLLSGRIRHAPEHAWMAPVGGLVSGVSSTSTGMSGPPVVLFFTVIGLGVQAFRATSVMYFLALDFVGLPALVAQDVVAPDDLVLSILLAPAALAGRRAGAWLVPYVSPPRFRRFVLALLVVTGLVAITSAVATMG